MTLGWDVEPRSLLHPAVAGEDHAGLLAVHSLSKQSDRRRLPGRAAVRRPGARPPRLGGAPAPRAAGPRPGAGGHGRGAGRRRARRRPARALPRPRRERLAAAVRRRGLRIDHSEAGLYLWATRDEDCWTTIDWLAGLGIVAAPGHLLRPGGRPARPPGAHRDRRADRRRRGATRGSAGVLSTARGSWMTVPAPARRAAVRLSAPRRSTSPAVSVRGQRRDAGRGGEARDAQRRDGGDQPLGGGVGAGGRAGQDHDELGRPGLARASRRRAVSARAAS